MLITSRRDTKNRIVKNAQMLLSAVVKLIFFFSKNIPISGPCPFFFQNLKKIQLPFVTLLEIPCISQVFLLSKMCSKMAYTDSAYI